MANGKNAYLVRVEYPRDPVTGKRAQHAKTFHNEKEAERQLTTWLADVHRGVQVDPDTVTLTELARLWLDSVAAYKVTEKSLEDYRATIEKHIIPSLGAVRVQKLTAARVQQFYAEKRAAGTGARTVELCHRRLSQILRHAATVWNIVPMNVCDRVTVPVATAARGQTWDAAEARAFLAVARTDTYWPIWLLILATGMRRGEALGLRWQDFDDARATATIAQQVGIISGKPTIKPRAKTRGSARVVQLPPEVVTALTAHRATQESRRLATLSWEEHGLVFASERGTPINPNNLLRNFYLLCDAAKVPRIKIHGMRHTQATWLIRAGRPINEVAHRLGHKRPSVTLDTYGHLAPDAQEASVEAVRGILFAPEKQDARRDGEHAVNNGI